MHTPCIQGPGNPQVKPLSWTSGPLHSRRTRRRTTRSTAWA